MITYLRSVVGIAVVAFSMTSSLSDNNLIASSTVEAKTQSQKMQVKQKEDPLSPKRPKARNNKSQKQEKAISSFLSDQQSPLEPFSKDFINESKNYNLDWRLLVSISCVESSCGKITSQNSYNPFGWANGTYIFNSWPESIEHVAQSLSLQYHLTLDSRPESFSNKYCPPNANHWAKNVNMYMEKLESYLKLQ